MVRVGLAASPSGQLQPASFILFHPLSASYSSHILPTSCILVHSSSPLDLSAALSVSQCLSAALHIYAASRLAWRLAAGSVVSLYIPVQPGTLCTARYSRFLSVLRSLLHLFPLQSSPLRAPRDCFSGSYGALSHTWAFIKSLILKDKFEYLY